MTQIKIDDFTIRLEDISSGAGKITVHNQTGNNYSYYWGAMKSDISTFIKDISSDYFAKNLLGAKGCFSFDNNATFKALRHFFKTELELPWYKHMKFQKEMRRELKKYQGYCDDEQTFVNLWDSFSYSLDYSLIEDRYDRKNIEKNFKEMCEVWNFIQKTYSLEFIMLQDLHKKIKEQLNTTQP